MTFVQRDIPPFTSFLTPPSILPFRSPCGPYPAYLTHPTYLPLRFP